MATPRRSVSNNSRFTLGRNGFIGYAIALGNEVNQFAKQTLLILPPPDQAGQRKGADQSRPFQKPETVKTIS